MSSRFEFRRCDCACSYCCVIIPGAMTPQPSLDVAHSVSDAIAIVPARWPLPLVMPSKKCANGYAEHLGGRRPIRPPLFEVWSAPSSHVAFLSHHDHSGCPLLAAIANRLSPRRPSRTAPQAGAQMFPSPRPIKVSGQEVHRASQAGQDRLRFAGSFRITILRHSRSLRSSSEVTLLRSTRRYR